MKKKFSLKDITAPKLRTDLHWSECQKAEGYQLIIKVPKGGRYYSFGATEAFLLKLMREGTDLTDIHRKTELYFDAELDEIVLIDFLNKLYQRGLLENPNAQTSHKQPEKSRVKGSPLYLLFDLHNPDRQLTQLHEALPWIFQRWIHILSMVLITLAALLFISNSEEIRRDFITTLHAGSIIPAWFVILFTTICHEYAHGLTCKHYGGKVTEMGFILLFFQPGLYVNVSDSWLFPEKNKRIWVMLAGMIFEIVLWSVAIIFWRISAQETVLNYISLLVLATSGFRVFINLNPLIKLDGYYALSDWLEIPNLRQKAMGYFINRIRHPWVSPNPDIILKHRRIFFWYGFFGSLFMLWILGFITSLVAGFLTDQLQGIGFILFVGLLLLIFKAPLARLKVKLFGQKNTIAPEVSREQQA